MGEKEISRRSAPEEESETGDGEGREARAEVVRFS